MKRVPLCRSFLVSFRYSKPKKTKVTEEMARVNLLLFVNHRLRPVILFSFEFTRPRQSLPKYLSDRTFTVSSFLSSEVLRRRSYQVVSLLNTDLPGHLAPFTSNYIHLQLRQIRTTCQVGVVQELVLPSYHS